MTHGETREAGAAEAEERLAVVGILFGSMAAQTLRAALRLRVVELIGSGERPAAEVAAEAGTQVQGMTRLLRALAALGLLREHAPGTFSVTSRGALLDPGRPDSMADLVSMFTEPIMLRGWDDLDEAVRTGDTTFDAVFGTDFFSHLKAHPEQSARFNAAMSQSSRATADMLPKVYDFGAFRTVADVGGGSGTLLAPVLRAYPDLTGIIHDTEEGLAQAPAELARHGLTERCALVAGDFFRAVPEGADLYLLKSIIHDWSDDQCATILGHCRAVLPPEGRVLIVEPVLPEVVEPERTAMTYLSDLNMLVNVGGRERTRAEFGELCGRAGLSVLSVTPVGAPSTFCVIEAGAA
ncbi:methyltransferase [Streptomyces sp. KL118A]|uniref:methyltransferase n=1 Tax=Streptomyces sp. KL118A TaxID=3045153 RepID=UPI00278BB485|nr:methyltransferase [Streptomyces sp. KL118A]